MNNMPNNLPAQGEPTCGGKSTIKINWKKELIPQAVLLACVMASFYFYQHFPAVVVTHWNFRGQPDGYSSKAFTAFFFPALLIAMYALFLILPKLDPKRDRYEEFAKAYNIFRHMIVGLLALIYLATSFYNLGYDLNIGVITATAVGLLMIVLGNYMSKIKKNWFIGIRTPWTMSSENVWNKTHRLGSLLFIVFGIIMMIMPYLPETLAIAIFLVWIIILVFGTFGYSWWIYRQEKKLPKA